MRNVKNNNRNSNTAGRQEGSAAAQGSEFIYESSSCKRQRCGRSAGRQKKGGTGMCIANGFLDNVFFPKVDYKPFEGEDQEAIEKGFYESINQVARFYEVEMTDNRHYPYPVNLSMSKIDIEAKINLSRKGRDFSELKILDDKGNVFVQVNESLDLGSMLYYIPILPVVDMIEKEDQSEIRNLLISVFSYLKMVVGVPMYSDGDCFLWWQYEFLQDWLQDDDDEDPEQLEEKYSQQQLIEEYRAIGCEFEYELEKADHLELFKTRVEQFEAKDEFEQKVIDLARGFLKLHESFPGRDVFKNAHFQIENLRNEEDAYDYGAVVHMNKLVSFIPTTNDSIYGWLEDRINTEFNECSVMEEPTIFRVFDGRVQDESDLTFERNTFDLIDQLCSILNNIKDE